MAESSEGRQKLAELCSNGNVKEKAKGNFYVCVCILEPDIARVKELLSSSEAVHIDEPDKVKKITF